LRPPPSNGEGPSIAATSERELNLIGDGGGGGCLRVP